MAETTLTRKGQVTVPVEIRLRLLGLKPSNKVSFTVFYTAEGTVIMRAKTKRLADLAGSLTRRGQPKISVADMHPFRL